MEKDDKGSTMIRMGVSGWMFLLVPAYPGCHGSKAVKRSLLLLLCSTSSTRLHLLLYAVLRHCCCWAPVPPLSHLPRRALLLLSDSTCYQSISPARWALSSKPATYHCGCWIMWQTDGQTDRQRDTWPFHRPCATYYAGSVKKGNKEIRNILQITSHKSSSQVLPDFLLLADQFRAE